MLPAFQERSSQSFHRPVIFLTWSSRRHFCRRLVDFCECFNRDFQNFPNESRTTMQGLITDCPLPLQIFSNRLPRLFPRQEIVTQTDTGTHRYTYGEWGKRCMQLANALHNAGVTEGDCIGTFAWNTYRHFELYFAVPCMGAVLHTLNIRLFADQLIYIINNAEDKVIFVDGDLVPLLEKIADQLPTVKLYVIMGEAPNAAGELQPSVDYETFIGSQSEHYDWPQLEENTAAAMCYTSGTTGNPKGVLYSHRSMFLHSMAAASAAAMAPSERDTILPIVPIFHANAWGLLHAAPMVGAKTVLPGRFMDPVSVIHILTQERVTFTACKPSILTELLTLIAK